MGKHLQNEQKPKVVFKGECLHVKRTEELVQREMSEDQRNLRWQSQVALENQMRRLRAAEQEEHRSQVYLRNHMIDETRREITRHRVDSRDHQQTKLQRLEEQRRRLREKNQTKLQKSLEARRAQEEEQERRRLELELREAERQQVDQELLRMEHAVALDRRDLSMAIQRLRGS
eukprot:NODE_3107_length_816_cov_66.185137_g2585_i0.p2 GENE.NODE_3107_length_816_cov_66.185137_g2585_i0~~NODE_3107_length_816_cov_66.185137_g2585_i0.p2  ORF type:complete len:184 (+),score=57.21 NODE_3107_length_816_cov_66.185137_g2585_i0:32-553(+)